MSDTLRAIVLMTAAMADFATADLSISLLPDEMPSSQILIVLGVGGATVFGTLAKLKGLRLLTPLWRDPGVLARNGSELIGTMGIVTALTLIPFSQASSIMQAVPLVVTAGAAVLLREPVGFYRWAAVLVGFLGVLVIVAPDPGDSLGFGTLA
ncbi:MAG: EamA family transporter, partial [Pseudomonadota bacterium]